MKRALFVAALAAASLTALVVTSTAAADDTECVGPITGTHDNIVVPSGAHCELADGTVTGSVLVLPNASFRASASEISGNVRGDDSAWVCLQFGSKLGGNFDVKGGLLGTTTGFDISVEVGGNAKVTGNAGLTFIDAARIRGNVDVIKNTGTLEVEFNTVGGNPDGGNVVLQENAVPLAYTGGPIQPALGGCGAPTSAILLAGGMSALGNVLPGNMQVFSNTGPGNKQVVNNTVGENLQCFKNAMPFVGGPNSAGKAEGQCF